MNKDNLIINFPFLVFIAAKKKLIFPFQIFIDKLYFTRTIIAILNEAASRKVEKSVKTPRRVRTKLNLLAVTIVTLLLIPEISKSNLIKICERAINQF